MELDQARTDIWDYLNLHFFIGRSSSSNTETEIAKKANYLRTMANSMTVHSQRGPQDQNIFGHCPHPNETKKGTGPRRAHNPLLLGFHQTIGATAAASVQFT